MPPREWFFEFDDEGLRAWVQARSLPAFTARQMQDWVYRRGVVDPSAMTDLPKAAREAVAEGLRVHLANGLYANAIFDRLAGGWRSRNPHATEA